MHSLSAPEAKEKINSCRKKVEKINALEAEFEKLLEGDGDLKAVLKYAAAYGAINAIRDYGQGGNEWCLIELSGPVCLAYGLTLKRGGFLEKHVEYLDEISSIASS